MSKAPTNSNSTVSLGFHQARRQSQHASSQSNYSRHSTSMVSVFTLPSTKILATMDRVRIHGTAADLGRGSQASLCFTLEWFLELSSAQCYSDILQIATKIFLFPRTLKNQNAGSSWSASIYCPNRKCKCRPLTPLVFSDQNWVKSRNVLVASTDAHRHYSAHRSPKSSSLRQLKF